MKKLPVRISCLLLSIAMLFSLLPVSAFAAAASEGENVSAPADASEDRDAATPEDQDGSEDEDTPEDKDGPEDQDGPEDGDTPEDKDGPEDGDAPEDKDGPEDGETPEDENAPEDENIPEDEDAPEDGDVVTLAAGDPAIPDYTQVTDLRQIKADKKYLIVAQAPDGTLYALYLNAAGTSGHGPGIAPYPDCTATLTVSDGAVSAVSTANTSTPIAMSDLHVTIAKSSGGSYTIKNSTHALQINSQMYVAAGSAPNLTLSFVTDQKRFSVRNSSADRYLTFNVNGATSTETHYPNLATGFCGMRDDQTVYVPIYLFIEGDLPVEPGMNLSSMLSGDQIGGGSTADSNPGGQNSWVFTGGRAAQGSFNDVKGARTYAGHFEEYVRYTHAKDLQPSVETTTPYFQRHVINAAYEGQTLADIVDSFDTRIAPLKPRAVSYLVDEGGSSKADFSTNLNSLITKALALQNGTGMIVIETLTDTDKAAVDTVVEGLSETQKANVLPVPFSLTAAQKTDGYPNANGHLAMAKQLADAVAGTSVSTAANWPYGVSAIPASVMASDFPNKPSLNHSHGYTNPTTLTAGQQAVKTKVAGSTPMTWLFMGDSITHGAAWTGGYDSLPQLFEKFVKDDLGRAQDIVINAGSSGATVQSTVNDLNRRLVKYDPDVVVLMLGTNNANLGTSEGTFKDNLRTILDKIIAKKATAVLRTPPPTSDSNYHIATYAQYVRDVAAESDYAGKVILVDQYALWTNNIWSGVFSRNALHPDEAGHLWFAHQLIRELALWKEDYKICQLEYVEMKEPQKLVIPGYTQITDIGDLDETKGYLIVSQSADGGIYALYPSSLGETLGAGALVAPGAANDGARAAKLTANGETVSAVWLKDNSPLDMKNLLFTIKGKDGGYVFTAFNGRHLNMEGHMFTEGEVTLTITSRGTAAPNAFEIKNSHLTNPRYLDFTKNGDPNAFHKGSETINTWGTDFWAPESMSMNIYLFESPVNAPTAKESLQKLIDEIDGANLTGTRYTGASWSALQTALATAVEKVNDAGLDGDHQQVKDAWDALRAAYENLNEKPLPPAVPSNATKITDWKTMVPASGTSTGEPFASGTGGSNKFRIPAIITLRNQSDDSKNGRLLAAIDARWNHTGDACGLDTIASYSDDNGISWNYNFPNYFGDSTNAYAQYGTAFIDPVLLEGKDGTIYLMVDVWPGGIALNTAPNRPATAAGCETINGTKRLVLYTDAPNRYATTYDYYVGDFDGGYAPVYEPVDGPGDPFSGYYIDEYYYLYYTTTKEFSAKDPANDKAYCQRLGATNTWVQQNVFFYNATLHVRDTSYLWIVTSKDGGETWGTPQMINGQVRTGDHSFYGVGPGAGLCVETNNEAGAIPNGTLILPVYVNPNEQAGFIYSTDGGNTWMRSSGYAAPSATAATSESCLVQIDNKTIRHFYRESWKRSSTPVAYTDHTWNGSGWTTGEMKTINGANHHGACQVSAIKYSQQINGKDVILYSTPTGDTRASGRIYAFLVESNKTMTLYKTYDVNGSSAYAYSSLTETADGDIALLYEGLNDKVFFEIIPFSDIAPTLTLTVSDWEGDYDGQPHTIGFQASDRTATFQFKIDSDGNWYEYSQLKHVFTDAGTHTVTVKATKDGITTEEKSATVIINPATPTLTITTDKESYTADEYATFTISGVPDGGTVTLRCSNTEAGHPRDISLTKNEETGEYTGIHDVKQGSQTFTASYPGSNNYKPATATRSITVAPAEFGLTARDVSCTYDGQPHFITVTAAKDVTLTYCDTENGEYTAAKPTYTNAGDYTTYFKAAKGTATVAGFAHVTISKATPEITFQCNQEGAHGGGEHSIETTDLPLVLTIGGVPAQEQGQFTLTTFGDAVRNLTRNGNGTWTASPNLPPITRTYTFTAVFDPTKTQNGAAIDKPNYNRVTAAFTVTVSRPADEVIDFNFDFNSAVKKDPEVITRGMLPVHYDGEPHSPLEALTYDKGLVLNYHVPVEYIDPNDNSGRATWTEEELKFQQPGIYTVSVMASPANSTVAKVLTVVLEIEDKEIATPLDITPSETELTGGGELTLTVTGMPAAGRLTVTCDKNVKITVVKRGTYTVTLPDRDVFYTFTASYSGAGSYQEAEASCTVNVTAIASIGITLESLELTAGDAEVALSPAFRPFTTAYQASVSRAESVTVVAAGDEGTTVVVRKGGAVCTNNVVPLDEGKNIVTVTVSNGANTTNYTLTITRVADKGALTDAITAANAAKQGVVSGSQAASVAKGTKFVTAAEMKALTDALNTARAIAGKADATQAEVDAAADALNAAVDTFKAAIKIGTRESTDSGLAAPSTPAASSTQSVTTSTSNKNGIPTTETTATPAASIRNDTATSTVNSTMGNEIVAQAAAKNSDSVVIAPEIKGSVSKTEVSIPASTVEQLGKRTDASLTVATPVASVTIPNGALNDLSKTGGAVEVTAERTGNAVELSVTAGGRTADTLPGGMKATVPVAWPTPGTVAMLVREDGTQQVIRKSTASGGSVTIPLEGSAKVIIVDNSKSFSDVPATNWAADAVSFVSSHELFNGTSSTTFSPDLTMSRGMLAVVLHNLEDNPAQALTDIFSDVDNSKWYAQGVAWAANKGIVTGYGDGRFDPNGDITREQLAVMLWRYAGRPTAKSGALNFSDAGKISSWALEAMRWATEKGIINGKGGGILDPTGKATRAQAAQMLKNFLEKQ